MSEDHSYFTEDGRGKVPGPGVTGWDPEALGRSATSHTLPSATPSNQVCCSLAHEPVTYFFFFCNKSVQEFYTKYLRCFWRIPHGFFWWMCHPNFPFLSCSIAYCQVDNCSWGNWVGSGVTEVPEVSEKPWEAQDTCSLWVENPGYLQTVLLVPVFKDPDVTW